MFLFWLSTNYLQFPRHLNSPFSCFKLYYLFATFRYYSFNLQLAKFSSRFKTFFLSWRLFFNFWLYFKNFILMFLLNSSFCFMEFFICSSLVPILVLFKFSYLSVFFGFFNVFGSSSTISLFHQFFACPCSSIPKSFLFFVMASLNVSQRFFYYRQVFILFTFIFSFNFLNKSFISFSISIFYLWKIIFIILSWQKGDPLFSC